MTNQNNNLIIEKFEQILKESLDQIKSKMKESQGIHLTMSKRLKFEKWFQIELLSCLVGQLEKFNVEIGTEVEVSSIQKKSKKTETIDITINKIDNKKYIGLELKIVPTSYKVDGIVPKTKGITDSINSMLNDLKKCFDDGYEHCFALGFFYPFPNDPEHNNLSRDFKKQKEKMNDYESFELEFNDFSENYNSSFICLKLKNDKNQ